MRYVVAVLLLASPIAASEPVYSWRSRADDPNRVYLYLDGKQIGGWSYRDNHYRPFDGKDWGPPIAAAPVRPPERLMAAPSPARPPIVVTQPLVVTQPQPPLPRLRGPLKVKAATVMTEVMADMTMRVVKEIPGAIVDSVRNGNYQLTYQYSVTRPAQQLEAPAAQPGPGQPARSPQPRWFIPRQ